MLMGSWAADLRSKIQMLLPDVVVATQIGLKVEVNLQLVVVVAVATRLSGKRPGAHPVFLFLNTTQYISWGNSNK